LAVFFVQILSSWSCTKFNNADKLISRPLPTVFGREYCTLLCLPSVCRL